MTFNYSAYLSAKKEFKSQIKFRIKYFKREGFQDIKQFPMVPKAIENLEKLYKTLDDFDATKATGEK